MVESGAILILRIFVGLKRIVEESDLSLLVMVFIVHERRMVKSINVIKHKGLSRQFCSEMLLKIGENIFK